MIPSMTEMFRALVSTPSVSCADEHLDQSNIEVIHLLANWFEDFGFTVDVKRLDSNPQKANLLAKRGSGEGGLVFAGHSDTVPCRESHWDVDPFDLTERDGRFYGLGTCDMKGFFPLALAACASFSDASLAKPLYIAATSDEETGMAGARELEQLEFSKAEAVVIGEPTDLIPAYTHKGIALLNISIDGVAGHSSNPDEGINAIDVMHLIVADLMDFRQNLRANYSNDAFAVCYPTLNLGCMHAGDVPNRICAHAELQFDIRILPKMHTQTLIDEIRERACRIGKQTNAIVHVETSCPTIPPFETSTNGQLVKHLSRATKRPARGVAFGTEAPFYQALGMEAVVFGPGSVHQAHQPDEYLELDRLEPTQVILEDLIHKYCTNS